MANHNLLYVQLNFRFVCALATNVPKFVIEAILRDFRFCILLVLTKVANHIWSYVHMQLAFGQLTFPLLFLNQPVHETRAMTHSQSAPGILVGSEHANLKFSWCSW